ncbi:MAG: TetR/AcrR family transcriptional regulator [Clostridiales bacterium]|nr:TetR/AcrR family transcriptional regulator [Clostridiales bacterium]
MQVKKEEVREKLLGAGEIIFQEVGFEKASLRKIVKEAGTTIGNFYNYFETKEELFSILVEEEYQKFMYFLEHHEDHEDNQSDEIGDIDIWSEGLTEYIAGLLPIFTPRFVLLVDKSEGTKYEGFKHSLIEYFEAHFLEHVKQFGNTHNPYARVVSTMFVNGLVDLIKQFMNNESLGHLVANHFMFFTLGTMGLIKNNQLNNNTGGSND